MDTVILVELLGRGGDAQHRVRLPHLPATVGRALDNDVIVDDPTVAAHHLRIERDEQGRLRAVDLGSRNGLFAGRRRVAEALAGPAVRLRIGHTLLRVRSGDDPLPPELPVEADSRWRSPWAFVAALVAYMAMLAFAVFVTSIDGFEPVRLVASLPAALLVPALWAGLWAAMGRVAGGRAQFGAHAALTMAAGAGALALGVLLEILAFAFSLPRLSDQPALALGLVFGALLYAQLRLVSRQPRPVLAMATLTVTVVGIVAVQLSGWLANRDDVDRLPVMTTLGPPMMRVAPGVSPEVFAADARGIESELEALRSETR
jgi:hypothetical protein